MTRQIYQLDASHSAVAFTVRHLVISKVRGRFASFAGTVELDPVDVTRSVVRVTIDAASIDTAEPKRDAHLRSADFFDVEHHPQLVFASTSVERAGEGRLRVLGDLTIAGTTQPVVLEVEELGQAADPWGGQRLGYAASTTINRRDFGLRWNQALEAGGVLVGETVTIDLDLQAVAAAAKAA